MSDPDSIPPATSGMQQVDATVADAPTKPIVKGLVAALVLIVIAAGAVFWMVSSGGGPAKDAARQFIDAMMSGDVDVAKAHLTADADLARMQRYMKQMQDWGKLTDASLVARRVGGPTEGRYDVAGTLDFSIDLKLSFTATLVKQPDETYRVSAFSFD